MSAQRLELLPLPRRLAAPERPAEREPFRFEDVVRVRATAETNAPAFRRLEALLDGWGVRLERVPGGADLTLEVDPRSVAEAEGYQLSIRANGKGGVRVAGADPAGLAHGLRTLAQLVAAAPKPRSLAALDVSDAPVFPRRGVMLDVSRDRVPTLETLFGLVEELASWKVNELQLYVEHTFAFAGREEVWRGSGALTAEDLRALDRFCAERHVRLIPNQQCFGHMHHWLVHARYRPLAECPEGVEHPFAQPGSRSKEPFSLCATDPAALAFVGELLDELTPLFAANEVNVGCDETFDLGEGRSREACAERGVGRVYLEYLLGLHALLRARDKKMQVWADILLRHPQLVAELPNDGTLIPMLWGYEAEHPFEAETRTLAQAALPYYVCPGTSSWQSLAGRLGNMTRNVASAVMHGLENGAIGVLVTDWGDRGHLQPLVASQAGFLTAADLAWNPDAPSERRTPEALAELLSRHVLRDPGGAAGRALVRLAGVAEATGARVVNASALSIVLTKPDQAFPPPEVRGLTPQGLENALREIDGALAELSGEQMRAPDRGLLRDELLWIGGLLRVACLIGLERLRAGGDDLGAIAADQRAALAAELAPLIEEHRRLWLARCRPGGLERSCAWLERVLALLGD